MIVDVLAIEGCPNAAAAADRVRSAITRLSIDTASVNLHWVDVRADATPDAFAGSPTIVVDGLDLFPSDGRTRSASCRVYLTPEGLAGLPTTDQIAQRLQAHG